MSVGPEGDMFPQQFVQQQKTPRSTHTPQDTGEKNSRASWRDLLKQNKKLKEQFERQREESQACQKDMLRIIRGLKTLSQDQFETWKKIILKQHEKKISLLLEEKASAFSALKEKAREAVEEEIDELNAIISKLTREANRTKRQSPGHLDTITHQVEALEQNLKEEQIEKEVLKSQVLQLQSFVNQQEQASKAAQNEEKRQRQKLSTKVDTLKSVLDQEKCSTKEVQSQLELQKRENQELEKKVSFLTSALTVQESIISEAESKLQTLQDEKVRLEFVVKKLRCRVTDQEETLQEQQARTQTLNFDLQTERVTSNDVIEKCQIAHVSVLEQINELTKQVKGRRQENESLRKSFKEQLRTAEQEIEELSEALNTSEETNSALKQENKELQETLAINEELIERLKGQNEEKQAFQKDMLNIIWGLKNRPQTQFKDWKENILKQHKEEISLLLEEKASSFSALKEEARKAVEAETNKLKAIISKRTIEAKKTERQIQSLLDTITQKTHQVEALKKNLKEERKEEFLNNSWRKQKNRKRWWFFRRMTHQLENSSEMNKQNSEAQTASVQMNCRQQHTAVQTEELQNTTDIYNMSVGPEGEMLHQQFVLQENTPRNMLLSQAQFEKWKKIILKRHEEISLLKEDKFSAFSALKEKGREAAQEEMDEVNSIVSKFMRKVNRTDIQPHGLLDTITHQVEALKKNLKDEQMEKEVLKSQLLQLQSSLNQQEQASKAAQNKVKRQRQKLSTKVVTLKFVLDQEKYSTKEVQSQLELQKRESQEQEKNVSFLTSALTVQESIISEVESKLQTLQDEKVGLEPVVKELHCRVTEQEETIQEHQARTQTLNLDLQTERVTFIDIIKKCHAAHVSALAQINELTKQVKDSRQENESLRNSLEEQLRIAEQKIEEQPDALNTLEEANSALKQENKELQETLATNKELREQLKSQKEEKQAFQKDMLKIIRGLKTRPQAQFDEWKEKILKQHEEEKTSAFSALKEGARKAVEEETDKLKANISHLTKEVNRTKRQLQSLLNIITQKTHQVEALKKKLKKEKMEKEVLNNLWLWQNRKRWWFFKRM
ncbi:uncharacterized protein [Eucyclogobius newberryi]|uniref:uncharacterized protein n=1 Tax=Eucyclogobius newberryi TaxID=166745 RepID=UPI003B5B8EC4